MTEEWRENILGAFLPRLFLVCFFEKEIMKSKAYNVVFSPFSLLWELHHLGLECHWITLCSFLRNESDPPDFFDHPLHFFNYPWYFSTFALQAERWEWTSSFYIVIAIREYNVWLTQRFYEIKVSNTSSCTNFATAILVIIFWNFTKFLVQVWFATSKIKTWYRSVSRVAKQL